MTRKPNGFSKNLIAAFVAATFSLSAGAALAQTTTGDSTNHQGAIASHMATKKSVKQLNDQLKKEDKEMRQANAELKQSRERLARTTRELNAAKSKERHVASAERQTSRSARQERRDTGNARSPGNAQPSTNPPNNGRTGTPE